MGVYTLSAPAALQALRVKIFSDGADLDAVRNFSSNGLIKGFTTNPSIMRAAGVRDYRQFAKQFLESAGSRPVSFEVLSDDTAEMERQARTIASWGSNVYVKIPVTDTKGTTTAKLVRTLAASRIQVNVTACLTVDQVREARDALGSAAPAYISLFAGRIADTGVDPVPLVRQAVDLLAATPNIELIWASPREVLNVFQADAAGCHVVTVTPDLLKKFANVGKSLETFSLETVKMFYNDAADAGLTL